MPNTNFNEYLKFIRQFENTTKIFSGNLYVYRYFFRKNPKFNKIPLDIVKFYDRWPAVLVFEIDKKNRTIYGLNLHQIPLKARLFWLERIAKLKKPNVARFFPMTYKIFRRLWRKAIFGVRQYKVTRVDFKELRKIPFENWEELFDFTAKTYHNANINEIDKRFLKFKPKP